jgi:hypothetical protein
MADDRERDDEQDRDEDRDQRQPGAKREGTIGTGMDSPDSSEAALDASTGRPDPRARGRQGPGSSGRPVNGDADVVEA